MSLDYSNLLSEKIIDMKPSGIRKFFDLLETMKDVVSLTVGQPDFLTPWHIRAAAIESLEQGKTFYTSNSGTLALRREIAAYSKRRFDLEYDPGDEIIVTVGGSEAIDIALRTIINPGDEVIVPTPSYVCYAPLVDMAGGVSVICPTREEDKFKLTPELLRPLINERTKLIILPFPNNPTGGIMTREDLERVAELVRNTNILLLSDEIYAELTYGRDHVSVASIPDMRERTVVVSGFSKAYAMTGWRLGYTLAPREITKQMLKLHQYAIMCAPTVSQMAAIEAMKLGDSDVAEMREEYDRRRKYLVHKLRAMGIECFEPEGAFYVFPNIKKFGMSSEEFAEKLLFDHRVAVVPGTAFGDCGEGFIRISYAYSVKHLDTALERIAEMIEDYKIK